MHMTYLAFQNQLRQEEELIIIKDFVILRKYHKIIIHIIIYC